MLLTCIQEVAGSKLGQDTDYSERAFVVFLSPSRDVSRQYLKLGHLLGTE
jgi:hypothetical protein